MTAETRNYIHEHRTDGAAAIAAALTADVRLNSDIPPQVMAGFLDRNGLDDVLEALAANPETDPGMAAGLRRLTRALTRGLPIRVASDPEVAALVHQLVSQLQGANLLSSEQVAELEAEAGGRMFETPTEEEVQAELDRVQVEEQRGTLRQHCATAYNNCIAAIDSAAGDALPDAAALAAVFTTGLAG